MYSNPAWSQDKIINLNSPYKLYYKHCKLKLIKNQIKRNKIFYNSFGFTILKEIIVLKCLLICFNYLQ